MGAKRSLFTLCLLATLSCRGSAKSRNFRYDTTLTVPQLISKYGYPVEIHTVQTSDGYLLQLHRIPGGASGPGRTSRAGSAPVALLQHAMLGTSATWVLAGPRVGLAYMLADHGYDVWLSNARGSEYSRNHTNLSPDAEDGAFWQFSWHEMGVYDLPATIDYILGLTGRRDLFYVAHSQGNTQLFVMMSEKPEYNKKVRAVFCLAPGVFLSHSTSGFLNGNILKVFENFGGAHELIASDSFLKNFANQFCRDGSAFYRPMCLAFLFVCGGFDSEQLDERLVPMIFAHIPSSSSSRQHIHYLQIHETGRFQKFDYGPTKNQLLYSSVHPPEYNLSSTRSPVAIYYGLNDPFCASKDIETLYSQLQNQLGKFVVQRPKWNHIDFLWGRDVKALVYDDLMDTMDRLMDDSMRP